MKWTHRQAALMELELLMFTVGGVRLAASTDQVTGVLSNSNVLGEEKDRASILVNGAEIPLLRAEEVFHIGARSGQAPGAFILFHDGHSTFAVGVDSAEDVLQVTPGDRLYRFLPQGEEALGARRPWGFLEIGHVPILLVDFGPVCLH